MDDLDDLLDDIEKSLNEEDTKSNRKLPRSTTTTYVIMHILFYSTRILKFLEKVQNWE